MTQFEELQQAIIDGKAPVSKELTEKMLKEEFALANFSLRRSSPPWTKWDAVCGNANSSFPKC